jgi:hypothetical protein
MFQLPRAVHRASMWLRTYRDDESLAEVALALLLIAVLFLSVSNAQLLVDSWSAAATRARPHAAPPTAGPPSFDRSARHA